MILFLHLIEALNFLRFYWELSIQTARTIESHWTLSNHLWWENRIQDSKLGDYEYFVPCEWSPHMVVVDQVVKNEVTYKVIVALSMIGGSSINLLHLFLFFSFVHVWLSPSNHKIYVRLNKRSWGNFYQHSYDSLVG